MEVIKGSNFSDLNIGPLVIALGTFDGIHLGHQAVMNKTKEIARKNNLPSGIYTFSPHPLKIIKPAFAPDSLISPRQKIELLSELDVDYYLEQKFTMEFSQLEYMDFVCKYLVEGINVAYIVVGEDFRFGNHGKGNIKTLKALGKDYGFKATGIKSIKKAGNRVSSTRIREMISRGEISTIPDYLGRYYCLSGKVIKGAGRGREIGFPTANLKLAVDYVLPPRGVYACYVTLLEKKYRGIANFGFNPTFLGNIYSVEVHIFDFDKQDIYGERLSLELVDFIREEITFSSSKELVEQIKKDILYTESLLCYN